MTIHNERRKEMRKLGLLVLFIFGLFAVAAPSAYGLAGEVMFSIDTPISMPVFTEVTSIVIQWKKANEQAANGGNGPVNPSGANGTFYDKDHWDEVPESTLQNGWINAGPEMLTGDGIGGMQGLTGILGPWWQLQYHSGGNTVRFGGYDSDFLASDSDGNDQPLSGINWTGSTEFGIEKKNHLYTDGRRMLARLWCQEPLAPNILAGDALWSTLDTYGIAADYSSRDLSNSGHANIYDIYFNGISGRVDWVVLPSADNWNRRFHVIVTVTPDLPEITLLWGGKPPVAGIQYHTGGMEWSEPGWYAVDKKDGEITGNVRVSGDFIRGWQPSRYYDVGDIVIFEKRYFTCLVDHFSHINKNRPRYGEDDEGRDFKYYWEEDFDRQDDFDLGSGQATIDYHSPKRDCEGLTGDDLEECKKTGPIIPYEITYSVTNSDGLNNWVIRKIYITEVPPDEFFITHVPLPDEENQDFCFVGSLWAD